MRRQVQRCEAADAPRAVCSVERSAFCECPGHVPRVPDEERLRGKDGARGVIAFGQRMAERDHGGRCAYGKTPRRLIKRPEEERYFHEYSLLAAGAHPLLGEAIAFGERHGEIVVMGEEECVSNRVETFLSIARAAAGHVLPRPARGVLIAAAHLGYEIRHRAFGPVRLEEQLEDAVAVAVEGKFKTILGIGREITECRVKVRRRLIGLKAQHVENHMYCGIARFRFYRAEDVADGGIRSLPAMDFPHPFGIARVGGIGASAAHVWGGGQNGEDDEYAQADQADRRRPCRVRDMRMYCRDGVPQRCHNSHDSIVAAVEHGFGLRRGAIIRDIYLKRRGAHPISPMPSLMFFVATFAITAVSYFGLKMLFGQGAALLFAFMLGQGHYVMAYLWSVPAYRRMTPVERARNLSIFAFLTALFFAAVFWFRWVSFPLALFSVIFIAVFHNFRDYEFFYRQFIRDFSGGFRRLAVTVFFSSAFLIVFSLNLLLQPGGSRVIFAGDLPAVLVQILFIAAVVGFVLSGLRLALPAARAIRSGFRPAAAIAFPAGGLLAAIAALDPVDLVYFFTVWHFVLWLVFVGFQTAGRRQTGHPGGRGSGIVVYQWRESTLGYFLVTAVVYAVILGGFVAVWGLASPRDLDRIITESFFWGLPGFVFFSFAHILFSALPHPRRTGAAAVG